MLRMLIPQPSDTFDKKPQGQLTRAPQEQPRLIKRQLTSNSTCGTGQLGLVYTNQYTCPNGTFTDSAMTTNYTLYTRCDDCGKRKSEDGGQVNLDVTLSSNCASVCCPKTSQAPTPGCVCPLDKYGDKCQFTRPFQCIPKLMNHNLTCSSLYAPYDTVRQLYSNPNCTKFKSKSSEIIQLDFTLDCSQVVPLVDNNADKQTQYNFQYWAKTDKVAITEDPVAYLRMTVVNMFQIRDKQLSSYPDVTPAMVQSNQSIVYGINMTLINSLTDYSKLVNFLAGGRVYLEVVMESQLPSRAQYDADAWFKTFLDFDDLDQFQQSSSTLSTGGIGAVAVACIVGAILLVVGFVYFRRRKFFGKRKQPKRVDAF